MKPILYLGPEHMYFEKKYGDNCFNYYFKSPRKNVTLTEKNFLGRITIVNPAVFLRWCRISTLEKKISNLLIEKHFKLKRFIADEILDFQKQKFDGHKILGVHYRGTDKITEVNISPFETYLKQIDNLLEHKIFDKVFFCSDEIVLRKKMKTRFKDKAIIYDLKGTYKFIKENPGNGIHFTATTPFLSGKDAVIECYLLSRCSALMSSFHSSFSLFATFINVNIPHIIIEP
ncbi:hypothetical protein H8S90_24465 [Olivibacter sp. SDN3]|uniref:hypothetical protein n=1 Tax=Olivibacter sp. SDN3 TaxID=2764720 RepID=UPI0016514AA0|nr:hypothetical protein [Olivibacter sp. SDN3]QNL49818.1 hypothetical protein H8S90_24465 [Olivibacter sp. SDN3]